MGGQHDIIYQGFSQILAGLRFLQRIEFYGCRPQPSVRQHIDPCSWVFKPPVFQIAFPCITWCPNLFLFLDLFLFCFRLFTPLMTPKGKKRINKALSK